MTQLIYREYPPHADWSDAVLNYWVFIYDDPHNPTAVLDHIVPPDACFSLVWMHHKPSATRAVNWATPTMRVFRPQVPAGSLFVGVRFRPGVPTALFDLDASQWRNAYIDIETMTPGLTVANLDAAQAWEEPADALCEAWLNDHTRWQQPAVNPAVARLVECVLQRRGRITPAELAECAHIGARQMQRLCARWLGLRPNEFIRLRRIRALLEDYLFSHTSGADIAQSHGYADQSHWIHEMQKITGLPPRALKAHLQRIEHRLCR